MISSLIYLNLINISIQMLWYINDVQIPFLVTVCVRGFEQTLCHQDVHSLFTHIVLLLLVKWQGVE